MATLFDDAVAENNFTDEALRKIDAPLQARVTLVQQAINIRDHAWAL